MSLLKIIVNFILIAILILSILFCIKIIFLPLKDVGYSSIDSKFNMIKYVSSNLEVRTSNLNKVKNIVKQYNNNFTENELNEISDYILVLSESFSNLNFDFICAIITHESALTWNPEILSPVGAVGLMQVMPRTAMVLLDEYPNEQEMIERLKEPKLNLLLGCIYMDMMVASYGMEGGLAAYNGGPKRGVQWNKKMFHLIKEETLYYVPSIINLYGKYRLYT
jgi:soluble lytic murein transglycosylase-like protein